MFYNIALNHNTSSSLQTCPVQELDFEIRLYPTLCFHTLQLKEFSLNPINASPHAASFQRVEIVKW